MKIMKRITGLLLAIIMLYTGSGFQSNADANTGLNDFVTRMYNVCLDREPDVNGHSYWVGQLSSGQISGVQSAHGFVFSKEFKNKNLCNKHYVQQLYKAFLGRESDSAGEIYWINNLSSGYNREAIFNGFALSKEFTKLCTSYGIRAGNGMSVPKYGTVPRGNCSVCGVEDGVTSFVKRLYRVCLGREADSKGLESWTMQLWEQYNTGKGVAYGFIFSKEFVGKNYSNEDYVEYLYEAFMGRASDAAGKAYWIENLENGWTRKQVFDGFVGSKEFTKICNSYGIVKDGPVKPKPNTETPPNVDPDNAQGGTEDNGNNDDTSDSSGGFVPDMSKIPSSTKIVNFDKQRLYEHMMSIYEKPVLKLKEKKSYYDFTHEINGTIPEEIQFIFDWYFKIMDGEMPTRLDVTVTQEKLFEETAEKVLVNIPACYIVGYYPYTSDINDPRNPNNPNGIIYLETFNEYITKNNEYKYETYSYSIDNYNQARLSDYDMLMKQYNRHGEEITEVCGLVENAVAKADIEGKDEVTAIQNIIQYLCDNCEYWHWGAQQGDFMGEWIKDCLEEKRAVCNGYAKSFYAMCYYAGIDVSYYWGYTPDGIGHAWNSVNINGTDYYFDVTWHDMVMGSDLPEDTYVWASKTTFDKEHIQKGTTPNFW